MIRQFNDQIRVINTHIISNIYNVFVLGYSKYSLLANLKFSIS